MTTPLIEVRNVAKRFSSRGGPRNLLARGAFVSRLKGQHRVKEKTALEGISFEVFPGDSLGIIGTNGSGKSTLLKLLAGVSVPSEGEVIVRGRVASLLELGAGFHPVLTGRENVYLNAGLLGMRPAQVEEVFDLILDFAGIGEYIDYPVNTYSSGMYVRLGFAVAVHANPDIFLVDEVLSVGDEEFQRKCRKRIGELREQGKTIVFVSHDLGIVNNLCNKVILLSKSRMMVRETPKATIDYYLRQIGRDSGIHTFKSGKLEAVNCHGRVSVFRDDREVSAPNGIQNQIQCMGQWHDSGNADWTVVERSNDSCVAHGRMSRLPVTLIWDMRVENDKLYWRFAIQCDQAIALRCIATTLFLPTHYTRYVCDDHFGDMPELTPGNLDWVNVAHSPHEIDEAALLPGASVESPLVHLKMQEALPYFGLVIQNTDYVTGARVVQCIGWMPASGFAFETGRHELCSLSFDFGMTPEVLKSHVAERLHQREANMTIGCSPYKARFDTGMLRVSYNETELTTFLHFYTSMLFGTMWNDSSALNWVEVECDGTNLTAVGESRRFPYRQRWMAEARPDGIAIQVMLEVKEAMDLDEYHASLVLRSEYSHWKTDHESGEFPVFEENVTDWRHANRKYLPGKQAAASSEELPAVELSVTTDEVVYHMTTINTGFHERARVLQALHSPGSLMHLDPGTYLYFHGVIHAIPESVR